jgi:RNA recognition motif-containing protein
MNGIELDGRVIKVRFTRPGRIDAPSDDNSSSSSRVSRASSADGKAVVPETETRVVVGNLPQGYTYREVFGMCSLFGEVKKVKLYIKSSRSDVTGLDEANDEQVEQDAAAVGDAAAAEDDDDGVSAQQQQQQRQRAGKDDGSAVVFMAGRDAAERVVAELNKRQVQGSKLQASLYRSRPKKSAAADSAASSA